MVHVLPSRSPDNRCEAPAEPAAVPVRGQWVPAPRKPVRNDHGHGPGGELDGLFQRAQAARANIRVVGPHAVHVAQLVLRRIPAGQHTGVRSRVPVRPKDAAGTQHDRVVRPGLGQSVGRADVRRLGSGGHPVDAGPVFRVYVPHDSRDNGSVGAAARARSARWLRHQRHTTGHNGHAGRLRVPFRQLAGLARRLLPEWRRGACVDGSVVDAGRRLTVLAQVHWTS